METEIISSHKRYDTGKAMPFLPWNATLFSIGLTAYYWTATQSLSMTTRSWLIDIIYHFIVGRCIFLYAIVTLRSTSGSVIKFLFVCAVTRDGCVAVGWNKSGAYLIIVALSLPHCVGLTRVPLYAVCQTTSFVSDPRLIKTAALL